MQTVLRSSPLVRQHLVRRILTAWGALFLSLSDEMFCSGFQCSWSTAGLGISFAMTASRVLAFILWFRLLILCCFQGLPVQLCLRWEELVQSRLVESADL